MASYRLIFLWFLLCISQFIYAETDKNIYFESKESTRLVELFTSQGCSSCPIAERWLNKFADNSQLWVDVVPVAFHVDYWDQLGWKDIYASPKYSTRQRTYHARGNVKSVYTPGFLVNGQEWRGFYSRTALPSTSLAGKLSAVLNPADISDPQRRLLNVDYTAAKNTLSASEKLHVAVLGVNIETQIQRGENAHRKLMQNFVVLEHFTLEATNTKLPIDYERYLRRAPKLALAIWVQDSKTLEVNAVTGNWLTNPS